MITFARTGAAVLATAALAAAAAGCGGDKKQAPAKRAARPAAAAPNEAGAGRAYAGLNTSAQTAEATTEPSGKLVAKSDFVLSRDGFAFRNYGVGGTGMRPQEVEEIFGKQVCIEPNAATCVLKPRAERWRVMNNDAWTGGHCYGFSTLSLAIKDGDASATQYGASSTFALRIADLSGHLTNPDLDADLTRDASLQTVAAVEQKTLKLTPRGVLDKLEQAWRAGQFDWHLGFQYEPVGGHEVVPIAIEDMGGGKFDILLYDNNFPYIPGNPQQSVRRFHIDTNTNTWNYVVSIRPDEPQGRWSGGASGPPLQLVREADQKLPLPCPFCQDQAPVGPGLGTTNTNALDTTQITLTGDEAKHGHLLITDADGHELGWDGTHYVNQITGGAVRQLKVIAREFARPEPFYEVPAGATYRIKLVDVPKDAPPGTVHISGPGLGVALSRLDASGTKLTIAADGSVAVNQSNAAEVAPLLTMAVQGNKSVAVVPRSDTLRVIKQPGDTVRISGSVKRAVARNPQTGKTKSVGSGAFDLSSSVGSTG